MKLDIAELERLEHLATKGRWISTLGNGVNLCTFVMSEDGDTLTFIADFLPESMLNRAPRPHTHNMAFVEAMRNCAVELIAAAKEAERTKAVVDAAIAFCEDPEVQENYEALEGSNSPSLPVEFVALVEAVKALAAERLK